MANIIRSAKSGSDWTDNELIAYNITISSVAPDGFFPVPDPSLDHIDPVILDSPPGTLDPAISDLAAGYLGYLDLAASATQESFVDDFAAETLKLLGFNERGTTTDVCLIHRPTIVLLVLVVDKTRTNAEAQVVADAIAAFQFNNRKRREYALDPLDFMAIPCITMSGTRPTFYLVPVTTELSDAVITGQCPTTRTWVLRCTTVATHVRRASTGMEDTEYRKLTLKRFLAFKT